MLFLIFYIGAGALIFYTGFVSFAVYGWLQKLDTRGNSCAVLPHCSIVVACRNESPNIGRFIDGVLSQSSYPLLWELVVVDDHSEDDTADIVGAYCARYANIRYLRLGNGVLGKKAAIALGLLNARYGVIVQTDADCRVHEGWLDSMLSEMATGADFVIGPVQYDASPGLLNAVFRLEFLSLVVSGAGLANAGKPVFCNAANMAYRADAAGQGLTGGHTASGDDVFLLHQYKRQGLKIVFSRRRRAIVDTDAPKDVASFFQQRVRWASKARYYTDVDSIGLSVIVAGLNIFLAGSLLPVFLGEYSYFLLFYCGKTLADMVLLSIGLRFFEQTKLLILLPFLNLFYPFYIVIASIYSIFAHYEWKGRRLR